MPHESQYSGRTYLVTGAGRGIGRAVVAELYSLGAKVYALSKNPDNLQNLKEEFPNVTAICVDLSDWNATRKSLESLQAVDCLINNAAILIPKNFLDITSSDFDSQVNVNLKSVINVSQIIAKKMIEKGNGGCIVNISSVAGRKAYPNIIVYGCTKAALELLTKALAIELGPHKIRVNSVCPAAVETDMLRQTAKALGENGGKESQEVLQAMLERTPTKTLHMPMEDVVNAILFLGSNATTQITGESLAVDGGLIVS